MEETLQKIKEAIKKMTAIGYGTINIEIKKNQMFVDYTYKDKIDLKK